MTSTCPLQAKTDCRLRFCVVHQKRIQWLSSISMHYPISINVSTHSEKPTFPRCSTHAFDIGISKSRTRSSQYIFRWSLWNIPINSHAIRIDKQTRDLSTSLASNPNIIQMQNMSGVHEWHYHPFKIYWRIHPSCRSNSYHTQRGWRRT